eukprot:6491366-Amphidinium_carterae.1
MQREIPSSRLFALGGRYLEKFIAAAVKEEEAWRTWRSMRPIDDAEFAQIMRGPVLRKRVIDSRCAYRDKNAGLAPTDEFGICRNLEDVRAKARVVAKGFQDPDLKDLQRHAPVCMRSSLHAALQIYADKMRHGWIMISGDIATAFLQGGGQRKQSLFMRPPRDKVTLAAHTFPHKLCEIVTNVYGLSNAPASFASKVTSSMEELQARRHPLDHMVFSWYGNGETGKIHVVQEKSAASSGWTLLGLVLFHVDDMLMIHHPLLQSVELLRDRFNWGSWTVSSLAEPVVITFVGKEIHLLPDCVKLVQQKFLRETDVAEYSNRGAADETLNSAELGNYRSVVGSLQWLAGSSRADLAAPTSLLQTGSPQKQHMRGLCTTLKQAKSTEEIGVVFRSLDCSQAMICAYSDASFANAEAHRSQLGLLLTMVSSEALNAVGEHPCSVLDWRSHRSRRVCRSTLASETIAADAAVDHAQWYSAFMGCLLAGSHPRDSTKYLPWIICTDSRSLHDAILQSNPSTAEKRILVDLAAIREAVHEAACVHDWLPKKMIWLPTAYMRADALTKLDRALQARFQSWLQNPTVRLRGDDLAC